MRTQHKSSGATLNSTHQTGCIAIIMLGHYFAQRADKNLSKVKRHTIQVDSLPSIHRQQPSTNMSDSDVVVVF
jgi:hypothetical protein